MNEVAPAARPGVTVGITTFNNSETIAKLLDGLQQLPHEIPIALFDDCSSDRTVAIIRNHPIATSPNFRLIVGGQNTGTPLTGRRHMAEHSATRYITFIDGDDEIDAAAFEGMVRQLPADADMIVSPFRHYGKVQSPGFPTAPLTINDESILPLISGVGGRFYRAELVVKHAQQLAFSRSEDAHLNMRILLGSGMTPKLYAIEAPPFYTIHAGNKSRLTHNISKEELSERRRLYEELRTRFDLQREYLFRSKGFLFSVIEGDRTISATRRDELKAVVEEALSPPLRRVVFVCNDATVIGGVASRITLAMKQAEKRNIDYHVVSRLHSNSMDDPRFVATEPSPAAMVDMLRSWDPSETVLVVQSTILRSFPALVSKEMLRFPIVYYGDAQLATVMQTRAFTHDAKFFREFRASAILSLSQDDISFQKQLGIYRQTQTILAVPQRATCNYAVRTPPVLGYVGVADFRFKATDRMIDIAIAARRTGLPPVQIYTSTAPNSAHYAMLLEKVTQSGISSHCQIIFNESDKERIYRDLSFLIVPSRNEAGGTVALEALSFGVPVIGCSYAPALKETVRDGENGLLFDEWDADRIVDALAALSREKIEALSHEAFSSHRRFSPEKHLDDIEDAARRAIRVFIGRNAHPVFPALTLPAAVKPQSAPTTFRGLALKRWRNSVPMKIARRLPQPIKDRLRRLVRA